MFINVTDVENQKGSIRMLTFVNNFLPRKRAEKHLLRDFGIRAELCNFAAD